MKKLFVMATLILSSFSGFSQESQTGTEIRITISNVAGNQGKVLFSLFDEATFMKSAPLQTATSSIEEGVASVKFENVAPGDYGVLSFHDKNGNGKMDFSTNGMPLENYAVSNNPLAFGPPEWSDAKFIVEQEPLLLELRF